MKLCHRCHLIRVDTSRGYCYNCLRERRKEKPQKPVERYKRQVYAQQTRKRGSLRPAQWLAILEQSGGLCHYCQKNIGIDNLVIEHVIPLDAGGPNSAANVVPACARCNRRKGTKFGRAVFQITAELLGDDEVIITSGRTNLRLFTSQIPELVEKLLSLPS